MKELDPGHTYELASYDGGVSQHLIFMKREGDGYPFNVGQYPGTNCQEVIRALIARVKYLNKQSHVYDNKIILEDLRDALLAFEKRACDRSGRSFPLLEYLSTYNMHVEEMPFCSKCGHIGCHGNCHE